MHTGSFFDGQLPLLPEPIFFELQGPLLNLGSIKGLDVRLEPGAVVPQGQEIPVSRQLEKAAELLGILRKRRPPVHGIVRHLEPACHVIEPHVRGRIRYVRPLVVHFSLARDDQTLRERAGPDKLGRELLVAVDLLGDDCVLLTGRADVLDRRRRIQVIDCRREAQVKVPVTSRLDPNLIRRVVSLQDKLDAAPLLQKYAIHWDLDDHAVHWDLRQRRVAHLGVVVGHGGLPRLRPMRLAQPGVGRPPAGNAVVPAGRLVIGHTPVQQETLWSALKVDERIRRNTNLRETNGRRTDSKRFSNRRGRGLEYSYARSR